MKKKRKEKKEKKKNTYCRCRTPLFVGIRGGARNPPYVGHPLNTSVKPLSFCNHRKRGLNHEHRLLSKGKVSLAGTSLGPCETWHRHDIALRD